MSRDRGTFDPWDLIHIFSQAPGTVGVDDIPNLPASKITSGSFHVDRIPSLSASKITSGEFGGPVALKNVASDPTGSPGLMVYNTTLNRVRVYEDGAWKNAVSSGGSSPLRTMSAFYKGGNIAQWQVQPVSFEYVNYGFVGSVGVGVFDCILLCSTTGGTYKVRVLYDADLDILCSIRLRSSSGVWSTLDTVTLDLNETEITFEVELGANESFGLHMNPGGIVGLVYMVVLI